LHWSAEQPFPDWQPVVAREGAFVVMGRQTRIQMMMMWCAIVASDAVARWENNECFSESYLGVHFVLVIK